ncbi:MAG: TAXI family TRAP transporter solute-binding subunit, partial [Gammaproteobacteria bacterium]
HIAIAAGPASGVYFKTAQSYKRVLAEHGVELEVVESAGSVENLTRLTGRPEGSVDIAFVQGGVRYPTTGPDDGLGLVPVLESLASIYFEPIWVFFRRDLKIDRLEALAGRRIAVGPEGSGTRALALKLLAANGIADANAKLVPDSGRPARKALVDGAVDCLFLVAGADSPLVRELIADARVSLMSFDRAEAYVRQNSFLSALVLPEGAIDLATNIPDRDIKMIASSANLVARTSLHPALVDLLLLAANEVHGRGGIFELPGQFPSERYIDFPLSKEARRFFKYGPPFLIRTLPFWAATWVDRLKVMLLPLLALLLPLARVLPPLYRWRVRSRIYRWYRDLGAIEAALHDGGDRQSAGALQASLERIDHEVRQVSVPGPYEEEHYHLRTHIEFVRERVERSLTTASTHETHLESSTQ